MNAEHLLTHFDRIADAPDAIPRLRRFILDLAVRGKLVPQDPNDEPASIPLMEGKYGKLQKMSPADISGWFVASVGLLLEFQYGKGMKASERLNEGPVPVFGSNGIVGYCETPLTETPSIIVGRKGSAGALNRCDGPSWTTDVAYFVEASNYFDLRYLLIGLQTLDLESLGKGVKPGLSRSDVYELPLSIPPLAEQHRIVAKVDELMTLCDRLEAARIEREATRDRMATASLARLKTPDPDPATFQNHAAFALNNLTPLTTRPDQIKALRQTILNLAVRGKLVPQDPNDEPAVNFGGAIPTEVMPPFDIPKNWKWARLCALGAIVGGGTPSKARDDYWGGGILWVSPKDMKIDYISETQMSISEAAIAGSAANIVPARSVLFVVRGMILAHSFPVAVTRVPVAVNQDMKAVVLQNADMADYVLRMLKGMKPKMLRRVRRSSHGTCRIERSDYKDFLVPVPPLVEQHRIVAKVDELMALCDRLEASLAAGEETQGRLVEAVLCEALHR